MCWWPGWWTGPSALCLTRAGAMRHRCAAAAAAAAAAACGCQHVGVSGGCFCHIAIAIVTRCALLSCSSRGQLWAAAIVGHTLNPYCTCGSCASISTRPTMQASMQCCDQPWTVNEAFLCDGEDCCLLPAACCLLPAACCLLPAACCLLPAACCLLPAACCLLPAACVCMPPGR
jgi:hypothetical protein